MRGTKLCPTLFDLTVYTVLGILQDRILEGVAYPFSSRSSQPGNQTRVSCIAGGFLPTELSEKLGVLFNNITHPFRRHIFSEVCSSQCIRYLQSTRRKSVTSKGAWERQKVASASDEAWGCCLATRHCGNFLTAQSCLLLCLGENLFKKNE